MTRSTWALMFGWFCGAMTVTADLAVGWSLLIALLAGLSFGVAEAIWDRHA